MLVAQGCFHQDPLSPTTGNTDTMGGLIDDTGNGSEEKLLASATLEDGTTVKFIEVELGIVMSAALAATDQEPSLDGFDAAEPVGLFEQLTHEPAPAALVAAQKRMNESSVRRPIGSVPPPNSDDALLAGDDLSDGPAGRSVWTTGRLTGTQFQQYYGGNRTFYGIPWSEVATWTNLQTDTDSPWRYARRFFSLAHCYDQKSISLFHGLAYWNGSGWSLIQPFDSIGKGQSSVFAVWVSSGPWYLKSWVSKDLDFVYPDRFHLTFKVAN